MAFEELEKMVAGTPDYLEIPVEEALLNKAKAVIHGMGYDMEEAVLLFLKCLIQTPYQNVDKDMAEEHVRRVAEKTLSLMASEMREKKHGQVHG